MINDFYPNKNYFIITVVRVLIFNIAYYTKRNT